MFYTFRQNNSGGFFIGPYTIVVEADSADEANYLAVRHDVYFGGVERGIDCECCGDRWHEQWRDDDGFALPGSYESGVFSGTVENSWVRILYKDGTQEITTVPRFTEVRYFPTENVKEITQ